MLPRGGIDSDVHFSLSQCDVANENRATLGLPKVSASHPSTAQREVGSRQWDVQGAVEALPLISFTLKPAANKQRVAVGTRLCCRRR